MTAFRDRPIRVSSMSEDFEHSVFASRLNSCARKSNLRPMAPPSVSVAGVDVSDGEPEQVVEEDP